MNVNKDTIIDAVHATGETTSRAQAERLVMNVFDVITSHMRDGNRVMVAGFGIFEAKHVSARTARNPRTGETVDVPARNKAKFTPAKALKDAVNQ
tara:strand:- start:3733 stop:4017 length:285 start_codon:yes stop_codon:yes gene_type:complete